MLILTRRIGEALWIGDDVEVVVLGCRGNQVRIGIAAPEEVVVLRSELKQAPRRETSAGIGRIVDAEPAIDPVYSPGSVQSKRTTGWIARIG
jgi:carbon storage regulator